MPRFRDHTPSLIGWGRGAGQGQGNLPLTREKPPTTPRYGAGQVPRVPLHVKVVPPCTHVPLSDCPSVA